jgi:hypothetical protein
LQIADHFLGRFEHGVELADLCCQFLLAGQRGEGQDKVG